MVRTRPYATLRVMAPGGAPSSPDSGRLQRVLTAAAVLMIPLIVVGASFLSLYRHRPAIPAGADTPWYVWRAEVVAGAGISALAEAVPATHTEVGRVQPYRAGYPIVA